MNIFISGGCKNGKSTRAMEIAKKLAGDNSLYYVATMLPFNEEDHERISYHVKKREGYGFITVEQPYDISDCLLDCDETGTFLIDSVTALLINESTRYASGLYGGEENKNTIEEAARGKDEAEKKATEENLAEEASVEKYAAEEDAALNDLSEDNVAENKAAVKRCIEGFDTLIHTAANTVIVSDYIYSDAIRYSETTEQFRKSLAEIDRFLAANCDVVIEICTTKMIIHKGSLPY